LTALRGSVILGHEHPMKSAWPLLVIAGLWLLGSAVLLAQNQPDVVIFDEDDTIGRGYYDASVGLVNLPSTLTLGGGSKDKMLIVTNQSFSGQVSGLLKWQSVIGGSWTLFIARPGFQIKNVTAYSNLVMYLNSPASITATNLPRVGLESSPPDVK